MTSNRLSCCDFGRITYSVFTRNKYALPTLLNDLKVLVLACDNANLFPKAAPNNEGIPLPVFLLVPNLFMLIK